jgi:hypothetical protein
MHTHENTVHSPGPWRVDGEGNRAMVRAEDAVIVCVRHRLSKDVNEANMRLIAAAPDLLVALQVILYRFDDNDLKLTVDAIQASREAVKKALGK